MSLPVILLIVTLLAGFLLGFPIIYSMLFSCIICIMTSPGMSMSVIDQKIFLYGDNFAFLAVPCFMLCGDIMAKGGLSKRLCDFCNSLVGWLRGGLSIVTIVACAFFAAVSGSAIATTAAIGGIMHPELLKKGYPSEYAAALPAVAGTLGIIIPPSIVFVIYGNITNTSVSKLLMAGVVPGVLCALAFCVYAYIVARARNYPVDEGFSVGNMLKNLRIAIFAILMPLIILGSIYGGIATSTESSAIACLYGFVVCCFIYRDLSMKSLFQVLRSSSVSTAALMMMVTAAQIIGFLLSYYNVPTIVSTTLLQFVNSAFGFWAITIIVLLICGMFLDTSANNLILGPIFAAIAPLYGIDPVHFGLVFVFLLAVGQATPPFGTCLFAGCALNNDSYTGVAKQAMPMILIEILCIIVFAAVPAFALWLPGML